MGTNVDCYQRAEGRYQLMRGIIAALRDAANPFSILTKGTLILRDLDLLASAAEVTDVGLNVSAAFVDKSLWRAIEPGTPAPERRLEACAALNDAGLRCGVLMGPVVPYLSDSPAQLAATVRQAAAAGAVHVTPIVLHLRPGAREWFLGWLRQAHPELVPRYAELYGRGSYARKDYQAAHRRPGPRAGGALWRWQGRRRTRGHGTARHAVPCRRDRAVRTRPAARAGHCGGLRVARAAHLALITGLLSRGSHPGSPPRRPTGYPAWQRGCSLPPSRLPPCSAGSPCGAAQRPRGSAACAWRGSRTCAWRGSATTARLSASRCRGGTAPTAPGEQRVTQVRALAPH